MAVAVHVEVIGTGDSAQLRASLGDRLRSRLALRKTLTLGWVVDRGGVRLGTALPALPAEPVVLVQGRLSQLDLPAYALVWQQLRRDALPTLRAQLLTDEMLVGNRRYDEVSLRAERSDSGTDLLIDSAAVAGMVRWPAPQTTARGSGSVSEPQPAELHLTRFDLPEDPLPGDGLSLITALARPRSYRSTS